MRWPASLRRTPRLQDRTSAPLPPIGVVANAVKEPQPRGWESLESRIDLNQEAATMIDGLDQYSHLIVVFWIDRLGPQRPRPRHLPVTVKGVAPQGVLATRSQLRPNPIGVCVVLLLRVSGATLWVRGLDAIDGTPVLDLKPYLPDFDSVAAARVPAWIHGDEQ